MARRNDWNRPVQDEVATLDALTACREILNGLLRAMEAASPTRLATVCWRSLRALWMPSGVPRRLRVPWPEPTHRFLRPVTSTSASGCMIVNQWQ
jgi:hypothetical protein